MTYEKKFKSGSPNEIGSKQIHMQNTITTHKRQHNHSVDDYQQLNNQPQSPSGRRGEQKPKTTKYLGPPSRMKRKKPNINSVATPRTQRNSLTRTEVSKQTEHRRSKRRRTRSRNMALTVTSPLSKSPCLLASPYTPLCTCLPNVAKR